MYDEFQTMKVCMTENFWSLEATMNHMVEIVRKMNTGDGGAIDGTASRSSRAVSSYTVLSLDQSKTSPPKRRRARSTRISHQHHTFWSKKQHMHKRKRKRKRKKISPTEKKEATTKNLVYKSSVLHECIGKGIYQLKQLWTRLMLNGGVLMRTKLSNQDNRIEP
ncbi:hypothetical protein F2Q68_00015961 [Brassica cretica]|uniref:Uncharacterized protein n=1 Tax=Brassica cretica TaxID=69181 RepID=A0A8S9HLL4_BRACR|nr:hypothetical protein F2Q68_00015961 [Brassica cretica]